MDYSGGTVYTAVTGPDTGNFKCWTSVLEMYRRDGDGMPQWGMGTKGYEVRQGLLNLFMDTAHDWLLMLDADMIFAPDTLERLRSHGVSYVSGYYPRRSVERPYSVWFQYPENPLAIDPIPYFETPERGRLHKLGGSGWGCVLLHRSVIEDTRPLLKGEWEILEDDMDVWPFDACEVQSLIDETREAVLKFNDVDALGTLTILENCIRPLRGNKRDPIGSDIRFPFYARQAGHDLWGDPDIMPMHLVNFPMDMWQWEGGDAASKAAVVEKEMEANRRLRGVQ